MCLDGWLGRVYTHMRSAAIYGQDRIGLGLSKSLSPTHPTRGPKVGQGASMTVNVVKSLIFMIGRSAPSVIDLRGFADKWSKLCEALRLHD